MIFLPRGSAVRQRVNPARINLPEAMEKLRKGSFTGFLRFDAAAGTGVILFEKGRLISAIYVTQGETERYIAYDAIARVFETSIAGEATLNIFKVSQDLILSLHALLHGRYLLKGKELAQIDVELLLEKIKSEELTVCIRLYAGDRVTLIYYDHGYPLGFFLDNSVDLEQDVNPQESIALMPGAKLDVVEIRSTDQIVLADLMGSADLRPIWQRTRTTLLEDRQKRDESSVREVLDAQASRRNALIAELKKIATRHLGKIGVTQVEKAANAIGPELKPAELERFYAELNGLARLVVSQTKIQAMLDEMRKSYSEIVSA